MFKQPKMPPVVPPPPPPNAPTLADASVSKAGQQTRAGAVGGIGSTIATTPQGVLGSANTAGKSLLGQ
tara:strand:+ start:741 stop:944 length:204 start_codon:yes stop_codon:yes gene_type:complete